MLTVSSARLYTRTPHSQTLSLAPSTLTQILHFFLAQIFFKIRACLFFHLASFAATAWLHGLIIWVLRIKNKKKFTLLKWSASLEASSLSSTKSL